LTGNLGWALTPVFMASLIYMADWRTAAAGAAALVAVVLLFTWLGRDLLAGKNQAQTSASESDEPSAAAADLAKQSVMQTLATLLVQPALWGAFLFFLFTSMSLSAVQNYTIPMLGEVYGIDKILAGSALSGYMIAAAAGMIAGGFLVGATPNTERTVAISLFMAGVLLVVLASGAVSAPFAMVLVALAGF